MNIAIIDSPPAKKAGKYTWLYCKVEQLPKGKTLSIEFETIKELGLIRGAVYRKFRREVQTNEIRMTVKKYKPNGKHIPTLYITKGN